LEGLAAADSAAVPGLHAISRESRAAAVFLDCLFRFCRLNRYLVARSRCLMPLTTARIAPFAAAIGLAAAGCAAWSGTQGPQPWTPTPVRSIPPDAHRQAAVLPAAHLEAPLAHPFDGRTALTADDVVATVLVRNPTLDQMRATAAAAAARYPQATALDDPTLAFTTAPGSAWATSASYAARVEVAQKFLYPGKRALKGDAARADAEAAVEDLEDTRLQLVEAARSALADYDLAVRATEVAEENLKLLGEFKANAEARYKTNLGQQQDVLQAEVEIARQEERLVSLRRGRLVAVARLNTLMHLPVDGPLPPPADAPRPAPLPEAARLREAALARPDVRAAAARVASEESALALAEREYKPDVEVMAAYDGFWQGQGGPPLQWQVGLRTNLPVRYARRDGAVEEARARVMQRRAELAKLTDQVNFQIQEAFERVREADEVMILYETKVLPAAEANVKEAQTAYVTGKVPFLNLIEAQRGRVALKDRYFEARAEAVRRRAELDRAVGAPLPATGR
jgi:outer membrane protein, heavy metal efflux system